MQPPVTRDLRVGAIVCTFLVVFVALALASGRNRSATWDEPMHLTAGYLAASQGDFRADPSHPPLLRMWAALPTLAMRPRVDSKTIDGTAGDRWLSEAYGFAHRFMYVDNDADRMLGRARVMIVLLTALLGVLVFSWAREWFGLAPASLALLLFTIEPNLMAHGSLVTTDLGVTTFIFATIYAVWRACVHPTAITMSAAAVCCALAVASKFSALVLAPTVLVLLSISVMQRRMRPGAAAGLVMLMAGVTATAVWAVYGFRFLPSDVPGWAFDFGRSEFVGQSPTLAAITSWIDANRLLPNAFTQGLLYTYASAGAMPAFLAGEISADGWWYYFPAAFLLKTPIALLILTAGGLALAATRHRAIGGTPLPFLLVPIAIFLGVAITSGINLGIRHILPIYPFVLMLAAACLYALLQSRHRWSRMAIGVLLVAAGAEFARAYPFTLAFFNQLAGGPANGYRYLADSNLDWGGNLKRLSQWAARHGVSHVNLAYFGQADPAYYGLDHTHLPGAPGFALDSVARPRLPGYVAISPTIMHGVYAPPHWRLFYAPFIQLEPVAVIGNSLRVYHVDRWPEAVGSRVKDIGADAHRTLADALLFGLQWPSHAIVHYREYLRQRPQDADTLVRLGTAHIANGDEAQAVSAMEAAINLDAQHGPARLMLARGLFARRDLAGAAVHAEHAVRLLPGDASAHDLLGRVRAVQGRDAEALQAFRHALHLDPSHSGAREGVARLGGSP